MRDVWGGAMVALLAVSAVAFVVGVALPLVHISAGGTLTPPATTDVRGAQ